MPVVEISKQTTVTQIECPPASKTFQRVTTGALHIKPGVSTFSKSELAHLKKVAPAVYRGVRVIALLKAERDEAIAKAPLVPPPSPSLSGKSERVALPASKTKSGKS